MRYTFKEIAFNSTEKRIPLEEDRITYIGLEHLDSRKLTITRYGSDVPLKGEKLVMRKGDVLFGKRNTYLKRVAIAPFDGLFSAHGMVLRPNEEIIAKDYFPFFLSSDYFLNEAIRISVGSLSPTVNWKDLKELEFEIPDKDRQHELAGLLSAANDLKESYEAMIKATDEMVKSQFISQFGSSSQCSKEELKKNVDEMFIGPFGSSLKNDCFVEKEDGYCVVYEQKHAIEKRNDLPFRYVSQKKYQELKRFEVLPGDIIVSCRGTIGEVYRIPEDSPRGIMHPSIMKIRLKKESYCSEYFVFAVSEYMKERESMNLGTGVKMAVTATDMGKELFAKPSISDQMGFISIIHQADKSKQIVYFRPN